MNHLGKRTSFKLADTIYWLSRFERRLLREWFEWSESVLPNPILSVIDHLDDFPPEIAKKIGSDASRCARLRWSFSNPETWDFFNSVAGQTQALVLLLRDSHPELSQDVAESIIERARRELGDDHLTGLIHETMGRPPSELQWVLTTFRPSSQDDPQALEWYKIDQLLCQEHGYRPWELERLTLTEYIMVASKPMEVDNELALKVVRRWKEQTPKENLMDSFRRYYG
jgi:hypothetical protein